MEQPAEQTNIVLFNYEGDGRTRLSTHEVKFILYLANKRIKGNRDRAVKEQAVSQIPVEILYRALAAEFAFCKLMNAYPDTDEGNYSVADAHIGWATQHGVDVKLFRNGGISIKNNAKKSGVPDQFIFAAMEHEQPKTARFRLVGWIQAGDLRKLKPTNGLDDRPYYRITEKDLHTNDAELIPF